MKLLLMIKGKSLEVELKWTLFMAQKLSCHNNHFNLSLKEEALEEKNLLNLIRI